MADSESEQLRDFLRDHVSSLEELSTLLFFVHNRRHPWSATEVARALQLPEPAVETALEGLAKSLAPVERDTANAATYRYAPSPQQEQLLVLLARRYTDEPVTILQLMSANAMERVRNATAQRLADAFRLDRKK